jgi:hypothetical protein
MIDESRSRERGTQSRPNWNSSRASSGTAKMMSCSSGLSQVFLPARTGRFALSDLKLWTRFLQMPCELQVDPRPRTARARAAEFRRDRARRS